MQWYSVSRDQVLVMGINTHILCICCAEETVHGIKKTPGSKYHIKQTLNLLFINNPHYHYQINILYKKTRNKRHDIEH